MDDCCWHWTAVRLRRLVLPLLQAPAPPKGAQLATRYEQVEERRPSATSRPLSAFQAGS